MSMFEPHTEIIRKGKASKPTEFGKLVKIQEAENQIITHFEVLAERPAGLDLVSCLRSRCSNEIGARTPRVAADAGFYSQQNEQAARAMRLRRLPCPTRIRRVRNANVFIASAGFVADNDGGPARRAASAR